MISQLQNLFFFPSNHYQVSLSHDFLAVKYQNLFFCQEWQNDTCTILVRKKFGITAPPPQKTKNKQPYLPMNITTKKHLFFLYFLAIIRCKYLVEQRTHIFINKSFFKKNIYIYIYITFIKNIYKNLQKNQLVFLFNFLMNLDLQAHDQIKKSRTACACCMGNTNTNIVITLLKKNMVISQYQHQL